MHELAGVVGVQPLDIQSGPVPDWVAEGIRLLRRRGRVMLRVGSAFDELSPAEQEAALASVLVVWKLVRRSRSRFWVGIISIAPVLGLLLGFVSGTQGIPVWAVMIGGCAIFVTGYVVVLAIWARRATYRHDRELTKLMGRPVVDLLLDLDVRKRSELRGFPLVYLTVVAPHETRRAERLDTLAAQR